MSSDQQMRGFGAGVRRGRQAAGMTQIELAARMAARGWPWYGSTVSKTESGDRPPTLTELYALAEVLDVDMIALLNPRFDGALLRAERAAAEAAGARVTSLLEQLAQARAEQGQHLAESERILRARSATLEQMERDQSPAGQGAGTRRATTPGPDPAGREAPEIPRRGRSR